jgi:uncharacterized membrane protein
VIANEYFGLLSNGSYSNSFYHETALNAMISNPPTTLVQAFVVCSATTTTAFQNSVGTSWANTQVLAALTVFFVLNIFKQIYNKRTISKTEQDKTMLLSADR